MANLLTSGSLKNELSIGFVQLSDLYDESGTNKYVAAIEQVQVICPHQVFIEVTSIGMLTYKIIILMKNWCHDCTSDSWYLAGSLVEENKELIKFRFASENDCLMFKLRWCDAQQQL